MQPKKKLTPLLKQYYSNDYLRVIIDAIYILNEIFLALYLLFIPIQIAYYWLLKSPENAPIQTGIDICVSILFFLHIVLYFDDKFLRILKNPYADWFKELVTI